MTFILGVASFKAYQFLYLGSFRMRPCSSSRASTAAFSASVPSQMWMPSGWHRRALRSTKSRTPAGSWLRWPPSTRRVWMLRHGDQHQGLSPSQLSLSEYKQSTIQWLSRETSMGGGGRKPPPGTRCLVAGTVRPGYGWYVE